MSINSGLVLRRIFSFCVVLLAACIVGAGAPSPAGSTLSAGSYTWVTGPNGATTGGIALSRYRQYVSANGRYVVFSVQTRLTPADVDDFFDVYLRDLLTQETTLLSGGLDGHADAPAISGSGRYVAFGSGSVSFVVDLVTGDRDVVPGPDGSPLRGATPASIASTGALTLTASSHSYLQRPGQPAEELPIPTGGLSKLREAVISDDGSTLLGKSAVLTCCGGYDDLFAMRPGWDAWKNLTSEPRTGVRLNGVSEYAVSADGRHVVFTTDQAWLGYLVGQYDLVEGNAPEPIWKADQVANTIPVNAISPDGRYVALWSPISLDPTRPAPNVSSGSRYLYILDRSTNSFSRQTDAVSQGNYSFANAVGRFVFPSFVSLHPSDLGLFDLYATGAAYSPPDNIPPTIEIEFDPSANAAGWWNGPVNVSFICTDDLDGSGIAFCTDPVNVNSEGANQVVTGIARDAVGNEVSATATLNIDSTPPAISCEAPVPSFTVGATAANVRANVADTLSGAAVSQLLATVSTEAVGLYTVEFTGSDNAGNTAPAACSYRIEYQTSEFEGTIESPPTENVANAGQSVPVRWRLTDASGAPISDPSSFVGVSSRATTCYDNAQADVVESSTGGSGLRYLGDGWWQYNWDTPRSYSGQCRVVELKLADGGSGPTALFRFR